MPRKVEIPSYLIVESGALNRFSQSCLNHLLENKKVVVICGYGKTRNITRQLIQKISASVDQVHTLYCKDNAMESVQSIEKAMAKLSAHLIIGVGGGKILDVSKWLGTVYKIPCMLVPTTLSSDAICSPIAVLRKHPSTNSSINVAMPKAVIIDLDLLAFSPPRLIGAGIGDLLSNKTALADWKIAHEAINEEWDPMASIVAQQAVDSFLSKISNRTLNPANFLEATAHSLIMCGIAMSMAGSSRPCSGSEHLISHALDEYCGAKALHGEQVAIGILIAEYLQGSFHPDNSLRRYFDQVGLPTHYRELGYTREEMQLALKKAPTVRERYTIFNELVLSDKQIDLILDEVF